MSDPIFFPERFKNPARFYTTGRPTYPKLLVRRVAQRVGLGARHRVLDLGTGPGFLAIDYAPLAASVTAVDPEQAMLAVARENAERAGVRVRFLQGSSFELATSLRAELEPVRLVTIGRAFHWMDRAQTLRDLDALVEPGGAVALFGERYPDVPENAWHAEFRALLDSYSTDDPARAHTRSHHQNDALFLRSSFDHIERISVLERRETPVERFVDRALSFGATWDGRPGSREHDLAEEVRLLIGKFATSAGVVHEVIEGHAQLGLRSKELTLD